MNASDELLHCFFVFMIIVGRRSKILDAVCWLLSQVVGVDCHRLIAKCCASLSPFLSLFI